MDDAVYRAFWNRQCDPAYGIGGTRGIPVRGGLASSAGRTAYGRGSTRGIPVRGVRPAASPRVVPVRPAEEAKPSNPKVVRIPVQSFGSKPRRSETDSALKIQKVFRGFMVRKNVKKIAAIGKEVENIQKLISNDKTVDSVRRDQRERMRISEMLMNLLFKLDSVTGVDSSVRQFRKAVIKKAISLQEALDAIVAGGGAPEAENTNGVDEPDVDRAAEVVGIAENPVDEELISVPERSDGSGAGNLTADGEEGQTRLTPETATNDEESPDPPILGEHEEKFEAEESASLNRTESQTDSSADPENLIERNEKAYENENFREENAKNGVSDDTDLKSIKLFEKMREENRRMMQLMARLCEKNEVQTRMLRSLSQRVDQLEKANLVKRSNRHKKQKRAAAAAEIVSPEKSPDSEKDGTNR